MTGQGDVFQRARHEEAAKLCQTMCFAKSCRPDVEMALEILELSESLRSTLFESGVLLPLEWATLDRPEIEDG